MSTATTASVNPPASKPRKAASVLSASIGNERRTARRAGISIAVLMICLALLATWKARELLASVEVNALAETMRQAEKQDKLPDLAILLATLRKADRLYDRHAFNAENTANLAWLHMITAIQQGSWSRSGKRHLQRSEMLYRDALRQAPANAYSWARLAQAMTLLGRPAEAMLPLWRKSIEVAAYEPKLLLWRSEFGITHRSFLSKRDKTILEQQISHAWDVYPWGITKVLAQLKTPQYLEKILQLNPDARADFAKKYRYALAEQEEKRLHRAPPLPFSKGKTGQ